MTTPLRRLLLLAALLAALLLPAAAGAAELTLRILDAGQGDAMLVVSPAGKTVLIDGGPPEAGRRLAARVKQLVKAPLDLMLLTHPHADHLGGLEAILGAVGARIFMEPGYNHPSPLYRRLLEELEDRKIPLRIGEAGRNVDLGGGASLHLLAPRRPHLQGTRSDANANSIVARLTYGTTAFYLAGDSELDTERRVLASGEELAADVYKVAHHGSRHASSAELLARIRPKVAVICVGAGNSYGHPTRAALERLHAVGAHVLRTDLDGEIVFRSDGEKVSFSTEKGGELAPTTGVAGAAARPARAEARPRPAPRPAKVVDVVPEPKVIVVDDGPAEPAPPAPATTPSGGYAASRNSKVFHRPDCANVGRIKPSNLIHFDSREDAERAGKRPAKDCNP